MIHMRLTIPLRWVDRGRQRHVGRAGQGSRIGAAGSGAGAGGETDRPGRQRKFETKAAATAGSAVHLDFGAVRGTNRVHDRQPKTSAAIFTGARRIDAIETIEDMRQSGGRDADAAIAHLENAVVAPQLSTQIYDTAARRELDGVAEQVDDHPLQPAASR